MLAGRRLQAESIAPGSQNGGGHRSSSVQTAEYGYYISIWGRVVVSVRVVVQQPCSGSSSSSNSGGAEGLHRKLEREWQNRQGIEPRTLASEVVATLSRMAARSIRGCCYSLAVPSLPIRAFTLTVEQESVPMRGGGQ